MEQLDVYPKEKSTLSLKVDLMDDPLINFENDPSYYAWTLSDGNGNVIPGCDHVVINNAVADGQSIVISGDQLQILDQRNARETRILTIDVTVDGLPHKKQFKFAVENLNIIT
ncbi:hypothetical protein BVY04_00930 [bacterium M21]|nr:hypothetical protein BVY04_00930 [bacterium M21]